MYSPRLSHTQNMLPGVALPVHPAHSRRTDFALNPSGVANGTSPAVAEMRHMDTSVAASVTPSDVDGTETVALRTQNDAPGWAEGVTATRSHLPSANFA